MCDGRAVATGFRLGGKNFVDYTKLSLGFYKIRKILRATATLCPQQVTALDGDRITAE